MDLMSTISNKRQPPSPQLENTRAHTKGCEPLVCVIIVNWNGWAHSVSAYTSLTKSIFANWIAIIVDNGSTDGSISHLSNLGPKSHLIESGENLGFAGGCNLGIRAAQQLNADYIFLLNNDAVVTQDTLGDLVSASQGLGDTAILGSVIRYHKTHELQFFGSTTSPNRGVPEAYPASEARLAASPALIESDFIMGAALFAPMVIVRAVGELDERYFLNFEETDWCYRARKHGHSCFVVSAALVYHEGSASLGALLGPLQVYFLQRNELLFCEKHCSKWQFLKSYIQALRSSQGAWRRARGLHRDGPIGFEFRSTALFLALRDYTFRRFGDCPKLIRQLAAEYSKANSVLAIET